LKGSRLFEFTKGHVSFGKTIHTSFYQPHIRCICCYGTTTRFNTSGEIVESGCPNCGGDLDLGDGSRRCYKKFHAGDSMPITTTDRLPVEQQIDKCPTCGYDIIMIGRVQKCTACGYSSKVESN
jgi:hypothetical protein